MKSFKEGSFFSITAEMKMFHKIAANAALKINRTNYDIHSCVNYCVPLLHVSFLLFSS